MITTTERTLSEIANYLTEHSASGTQISWTITGEDSRLVFLNVEPHTLLFLGQALWYMDQIIPAWHQFDEDMLLYLPMSDLTSLLSEFSYSEHNNTLSIDGVELV